jgi:hypothetical protein
MNFRSYFPLFYISTQKAWDVFYQAKTNRFTVKVVVLNQTLDLKLKMKNIAIIMEAIPANIKFHLSWKRCIPITGKTKYNSFRIHISKENGFM